MIDYRKATRIFQGYLQKFDLSDDKIHLKVVHTYGVVKAAEYLGKALHLSEEDYKLAQLIALLHDIGRFRQLKLYNSFDDRIINHATLAVEILQENDFIRQFVEEDIYDEIIYTALLNHNTYAIDEKVTGKALLHTQIIRDADKLDNYRVKETESFETLFDINKEQLNQETITPHIYQEYSQHHLILSSDRKTHLDMWLSYFAFMYDLNFPESLAYIQEKDYLNKIFPRVTPENPKTKKEYQELYEITKKYLAEKSGSTPYS